MKKLFAWILLVIMLTGVLTGCGCQKQPAVETEPTTTTAPVEVAASEIQDVIEYLKAIYKDDGAKTPVNFERFGIVRIAGVPYEVVWTTDLGEDMIKIIVNDDGTVTIDVNEECPQDTPYVLTATVTDENGNTATHSWNYILPQAVDQVAVVEAAYALKPGESLPYESTLRGKIISIDTIWDDNYKNITVTIEIKGAEGKPIKCYRLKGEGADKLLVGNIITVTGTLKNYNGTIEFDAGCVLDAVEKGDAVEAPTDPGQILKEAYALADGKVLPYPAELTGTVIEIDNPYDPAYGNISVIIEVEGYSQYPILCYRLKGADVENIAVNDLITVKGIIKNYKGTIEFDTGSQMIKRVSGGGTALKPSSDEAKILRDAAKLASGEKLQYRATLTGEVISVDNAYDPGYGNVTVTMLVSGTKIQCYRMKGADAANVRVTDKITVTGIIENYKGKLEFGSGCTLDKWVKGSRVVKIDMGPLKENTAYKMEMKLPPLGKNVYFNGEISAKDYLQTGTYDQGVDVYMVKTEGKGVRFYFMDGETKTYIEIYENSEGKKRPHLTTSPNGYWEYSTDAGLYVYDIDGGKYYLGTYTNDAGETFETASCSSTYYITDGNAANKGKTQFYFEFVTSASSEPDAPVVPDGPAVETTIAEAVSGTIGQKYTVTGVITLIDGSNVYLQDATGAICVRFSERVEGFQVGHVIKATGKRADYNTMPQLGGAEYTVASGIELKAKETNIKALTTKDVCTYVKLSGLTVTEVFDNNGQYTSPNITLMDADGNTIQLYKAMVNKGSVKVGDTLNLYCAVGIHNGNLQLRNSYATEVAVAPAQPVKPVPTAPAPEPVVPDEPETPDTPDTPDVPEVPAAPEVVETPKAGTAYKFGMAQGNLENKVYYLVGGMNGYYMATTEDATAALDVYLEETDGGYYLYAMVDGAKQYINMVVSGTHVNGAYEATASTVYTYDAEAKTVIATVDGAAYWHGTRNDKTYTTVGPCKVEYEGFYCQFYAVESSETPDTPDTPDVPEVPAAPEVVETPVAGTAYKFGMVQGNVDDKTFYITGAMDGYYMATTEDAAAAADVYLEETNGGYYLYAMVNGQKLYINMVVSGTHVNGAFEAAASTIYTYDEEAKTIIATVEDAPYWFGTRNDKTYTTVGPCKVEYEGFYCQFYAVESSETPDTPDVPEVPAAPEVVETPVAGTAYKFGMAQGNLENKVYYLVGGMNGYYMATTEDATAALDVYLEETDGGYYLYAMVDGAKQYINMVVSGTHVNGAYEATASTVYTYDAEAKTVIATVDGAPYWFGTRNDKTYTTVGPCKVEYEGFYCQFYATQGSETPDAPEAPEGVVDIATALAATEGTFTVRGVVTLIDSSNYYVQDATGAICVRLAEKTTEIALGDTIIGTGTRSVYNNLPQLQNSTFEKSSGLTLKAKETTIGDLTTADLCTYITLKNLTVTSITGTEYYDAVLTDANGKTIKLYKGVVGKNGDALAIKAGDVINITCALGCYKEDLQLRNTKAEEIELVTAGSAPEETTPTEPVTPEAPKGDKVSISFANVANRVSQDTGKQVWAQNGITVTNEKGASTSNVADYSNPARFYKSSKLAVAYTGMTAIVFNCNTADYATALQASIPAASGVAIVKDGATVTVTFTSAVNSFTIDSLTGGQVRVDSIDVYNG